MIQKNPEKTGDSLFKFFLIFEIIIGIAVILYGISQSSNGYPSLERLSDEPGLHLGTQVPRPVEKVNLVNLKNMYSLPKYTMREKTQEAKLERLVFQKINEERKKRRLPVFQWEQGLADTSLYHSTDMGKNSFFDHQNPDNVGFSFRVAMIHRRYAGGSQGENILKVDKNAENSGELADRIIKAWMNSTGHRENILNDSFDCAGVGCFETSEDDRTFIYSTLILGESIGYLTEDFPRQARPGQEIFVRIKIVKPGKYLVPASARILNIENYARHGNFTLKTHSKTDASATISTPPEDGIYQLVFPVPNAGNPDTFEIVNGPLFVVKKDK